MEWLPAFRYRERDSGKCDLVLGEFDVGDILTSPTIAGGVVLLVYAIGSLAEMFGELFLVRAASGIFWGFQFPVHAVKYKNKVLRMTTRTVLTVFVGPILAIFFALYGFMGRTHYTIDITALLSQGAQKLYEALPEKVARGLRMPVGDDTEFALKFVIDELESEADRKWARRLVIRAKDVAATITALQVVFLYILILNTGLIYRFSFVGSVVVFVSIWLPFLLLYQGFFTTLRNAIVSILEALALKSPAPAGDASPKA